MSTSLNLIQSYNSSESENEENEISSESVSSESKSNKILDIKPELALVPTISVNSAPVVFYSVSKSVEQKKI